MAGIEGGQRPRNKEAAFDAGSAGGGGTGWQEQSDVSVHTQLVARFRSELARAKEGVIDSITEDGGPERRVPAFNTADWFRKTLFRAQDTAARDPSVPAAAHRLYYDLSYAWEAVAYTSLSEEQQRNAQYGAIEYVYVDKRDSVTLSPQGVQVLDAMAEVAGLPDYVPGRTEIPLPLETMLGEGYAASLRPGLRQREAEKGQVK